MGFGASTNQERTYPKVFPPISGRDGYFSPSLTGRTHSQLEAESFQGSGKYNPRQVCCFRLYLYWYKTLCFTMEKKELNWFSLSAWHADERAIRGPHKVCLLDTWSKLKSQTWRQRQVRHTGGASFMKDSQSSTLPGTTPMLCWFLLSLSRTLGGYYHYFIRLLK